MVFFTTHVGLATRSVRAALAGRLGELGFTVLYFVIASASFAALAAYYAAHRFEGPAGLALGTQAELRWVLMAVTAAGVMLSAAGLAIYPRMPMALFDPLVREPRGVERITRHPFFAGTALAGLAHVLLATRLTGTIFAAGLVLLSVVGPLHQDRKLLARRGEPYRAYLAATSFVPFAAIAAGRQRLVMEEIPFRAAGYGLAIAVALRLGHELIFAHGGAWVIGALVGGGLIAGGQSALRARRQAAKAAAAMPAARRAS
jgi:uncharacterized membrane protein